MVFVVFAIVLLVVFFCDIIRNGLHFSWPIVTQVSLAIVIIKENGYETCQSSLLFVIVLFFGLDPAQSTIVVYSIVCSELRN